MIRLLLIAIPLMTLLVPRHWFRRYVIVLTIVSLFFGSLLAIEQVEAAEPGETIGLIAIVVYLAGNAILIGLRAMWLRKPPRQKMLALPHTSPPPPTTEPPDATPPTA